MWGRSATRVWSLCPCGAAPASAARPIFAEGGRAGCFAGDGSIRGPSDAAMKSQKPPIPRKSDRWPSQQSIDDVRARGRTLRGANSNADRAFQFAAPVKWRFGRGRAVARLDQMRGWLVRPDQRNVLVGFRFELAAFSCRRARERRHGEHYEYGDRRDEYPQFGNASAIPPAVSRQLQHIPIPMLCLFGHPADETDRAFSIFVAPPRLAVAGAKLCLNEAPSSPGGSAPWAQHAPREVQSRRARTSIIAATMDIPMSWRLEAE